MIKNRKKKKKRDSNDNKAERLREVQAGEFEKKKISTTKKVLENKKWKKKNEKKER